MIRNLDYWLLPSQRCCKQWRWPVPPFIESTTCQLDIPTQNGRMDGSFAELSIGTLGRLRYLSWFIDVLQAVFRLSAQYGIRVNPFIYGTSDLICTTIKAPDVG